MSKLTLTPMELSTIAMAVKDFLHLPFTRTRKPEVSHDEHAIAEELFKRTIVCRDAAIPRLRMEGDYTQTRREDLAVEYELSPQEALLLRKAEGALASEDRAHDGAFLKRMLSTLDLSVLRRIVARAYHDDKSK